MPLGKDAMREDQRRRRMIGERCQSCGKAAAEKYHRINRIVHYLRNQPANIG